MTTSGAGPSTTLVAGPTIVLGYLGPLTGPKAASGRAMQLGADVAVQQFQADHASFTVRLDSLDVADPARAAAQASRLVHDGVVGVIGPADEAEALAVDPVLEAADVPQIAVSATGDDLAESGDPEFHRVVADDTDAGAADASFLFDHDATSVAVVSDGVTDLTLTTSLTDSLGADAVSAGIPLSIAAPGAAAVDDTAAQITEATPPPDWVFFAGDASTGGQLVDALETDSYSGNILLAGAAGDPAQAEAAGWTADGFRAYLSCPCEGDPGPSTPQVAFGIAYRADNGVAPPEWSTQAFDAANAVLDATLPSSLAPSSTTSSTDRGRQPTPAAAPSSAVSAAAVEGVLSAPGWSASGLSGPISFTPDGNLVSAPVWISDVDGGKVTQETDPVTAPPGTAGD